MVPSERYVVSLLDAAEMAHGRPLGSGTTLVVDPERNETGSATCYPTPHASIVWCDASVLERLAGVESSFDDIAVLTHPAWRGRRLGALTVYEFIRHRQAEDRCWFYRCNVDKVGSSRVAESLGFTLVTAIGAVSFPPG